MKKYLTILALTVGASLIGAVSAHAQLFAYDGFDGSFVASGANQTMASGSGDWKFDWFDKSSISTLQAGSMSYSTLPTTGGNIYQANNTQMWRVLGSNFGDYANSYNTGAPGTLWMSYLWASDNTGNYDSDFNLLFRQATVGFYKGGNASSSAGSEMLDIGMPNISSANVSTVSPNISLWNGGHGLPSTHGSSTAPDIQSSVAADNSTQFFILIEMLVDQNSLTADTMNIWIDPTLGVAPGTPDMVYSAEDLSRIDTLRMSANSLNATYGGYGIQQFDEFRLGTDMTSVETLTSATLVPEPVSMALLGFGGLSLLLFRRKQ
jgi:hypothetical protein